MPLDPSKAPQGPRDAAEIRERARIRQTGGLEPSRRPSPPSPPDAWQPHSPCGWPKEPVHIIRTRAMPDPKPRPGLSTVTIGALCGIAAATCWGAGFVAAKHGIASGLAPTDLAFHRFVWSGLLLMPLVAKAGASNLGGVGWPRGLVILVLAGPLQAITSYTGFTLAPLGHGAVIHPASAALGGTLLAYLVLGEPLTRARILGVAGIVLGLIVFAGEAITTLGGGAPLGDALFTGAGLMWAVFTICLRKWQVSGLTAARIVGALSLLIYAPLYAYFVGFDRMIAAGLTEN